MMPTTATPVHRSLQVIDQIGSVVSEMQITFPSRLPYSLRFLLHVSEGSLVHMPQVSFLAVLSGGIGDQKCSILPTLHKRPVPIG